ncbi:carboxyl-terminal protease-related protein [Bacteroides graminisolvens DSM 19988 = JCM 15093]|uniref:Carboxyl-terminal protease-related protein n=1 Tax=Bacteroides graminisolvens DSM 19988 = JCM 15093 TaxID=1121097 RepID=A0A069CY82_9BACE|nr:carboxyl-terminal protease-related protein [Bacteroides graminisolvens DSM 19988 = JCM 15093]
MKRHIKYLILLTVVLFSSCIGEEEYDNSPQGNFDALWTIIDEKYCFLDYKGINWDSIYTVYQKKLTPTMSDENLFEVLGDMLDELKDGHVNLYSSSDVARYWIGTRIIRGILMKPLLKNTWKPTIALREEPNTLF